MTMQLSQVIAALVTIRLFFIPFKLAMKVRADAKFYEIFNLFPARSVVHK